MVQRNLQSTISVLGQTSLSALRVAQVDRDPFWCKLCTQLDINLTNYFVYGKNIT